MGLSRRRSSPLNTGPLIVLSRASFGRAYRVLRILQPSRSPPSSSGSQREATGFVSDPPKNTLPPDNIWRNTVVRLAELGIFPGQVIEKTGSAGPRCAVILKAGGSKVAVSLDLCSQILVRAI
ncbi:MAG: FeoA family protein [Bacillota bacterium]